MTKIIVDSICGLTQQEAHKQGYGYLPIWIFDGEKRYKDGIDITTEEIIKKQFAGANLKTSQPSTV